MHSPSYVFGSDGIINSTGGWPSGIAFLLGLLSVQWTMTDYDASARQYPLSKSYPPLCPDQSTLDISCVSRIPDHLVFSRPNPESLVARRSSVLHMPVRNILESIIDLYLFLDTAPVAIFIAAIGTGIIGWLFNITLVLCSGPL